MNAANIEEESEPGLVLQWISENRIEGRSLERIIYNRSTFATFIAMGEPFNLSDCKVAGT